MRTAADAQLNAVLTNLHIARTKLTRLLEDDPSHRDVWIRLDNLIRELEQ